MPADYNIPFPLTTKHQPAMNPYLSQLQPYPFARLREAMQDIHPPEGVAPVPLQIGEPKHPAPAVITDALTAATEAAIESQMPRITGRGPCYGGAKPGSEQKGSAA